MEAFFKGVRPSTSGLKDKTGSQKDGSKPGRKQATPPWVEKYRPKTVDEVAFQEEVVNVLKKTLQGADFPNLLFYGPPGTGKTSTILALGRQIFGEMYQSRILELNASDERGIQVIREKVKNFAQQTASDRTPEGKPCPAFKIVILDEADSMTKPAQDSLRRTMERQSKSTRFCLICNYVSRITGPLTSRCSKFRFKPLSRDILIQRLQDVTEKECVKVEPGVLDSLVDISQGDLRKAITLLQSAHRLKGNLGINLDDILEIGGVIPFKWLDKLFDICKSDSYEKLETFVTDMVAEGFSAGQLMSQLHDKIVFTEELNDKQKSVICNRLAVCDHCLMDGADEFLQIMDLTTVIMHQFCHASS